MSRSHKPFAWPVRVYYQDTDAGGVVYHTNYVNFMERARTEWLRSFGHSNAGLMKELGVMFVVRSIKIDYLKPALLDDMLTVTAHLTKVGRSQMTLVQEVIRGDELLTQAEVHLVCVGKDSFKPVSVPEMLRKQWE
ncbi:MAG: tol-pal system-associated acyl-CoA thioesterase [Sideroxydans sp. RIFOXYB12_FULL_59_6]|nr:MAG: tol-pal system-associated acyl-CoA thioesterase [Sideroxydans sp. RIFOXYB12_FULL_59_6]